MPSKVTFAADSLASFIEETRFAEQTYGRSLFYAGRVINFWESYRTKLRTQSTLYPENAESAPSASATTDSAVLTGCQVTISEIP